MKRILILLCIATLARAQVAFDVSIQQVNAGATKFNEVMVHGQSAITTSLASWQSAFGLGVEDSVTFTALTSATVTGPASTTLGLRGGSSGAQLVLGTGSSGIFSFNGDSTNGSTVKFRGKQSDQFLSFGHYAYGWAINFIAGSESAAQVAEFKVPAIFSVASYANDVAPLFGVRDILDVADVSLRFQKITSSSGVGILAAGNVEANYPNLTANFQAGLAFQVNSGSAYATALAINSDSSIHLGSDVTGTNASASTITGTSVTSGTGNGGNVTFSGGSGSGAGVNGDLILRAGQTSSPGSTTTGGSIYIYGGKPSNAQASGNIILGLYSGDPSAVSPAITVSNTSNNGVRFHGYGAGVLTTDSGGNITSTVMGSGILTFLGSPSSANFFTALSDETGSGLVVGNNSPTLITPNIGAATGTSLSLSGNISSNVATSNSIVVNGSGVAGAIALTQGTAPSAGTTNWTLYAPTSVTSYKTVVPGATGTGLWLGTDSSGTETLTRVTAIPNGYTATTQSAADNSTKIATTAYADAAVAAGVTATSTTTLTNKRITKRVLSAASYTTNTGSSLNADTQDMFIVTAQAGALKFNNPSGTPTDGQTLWLAVTGTAARALTYDTQFESSTVTLPTTTITTARTDIGLVWRADTSMWHCVAVAQ